MLQADRATLFLNDEKKSELFSRVAMGGTVGEIRMPNHLGIAGAVFTSGQTINIPYAYARKGKAFALDVQVPYTYFELGRAQVSFPFTVFNLQTLKCYHPLAQAAISGIRVV